MRSALLLSILVMTVTIPLIASRQQRSKKGLRYTLIGMAIYIAIWGYCVKQYYWVLD
jgi:hypothetical protein